MNRRQLLIGTATGALFAGVARAAWAGKAIMPWEYIEKKDQIKNTDGTPLQFMPKTAPDDNPLENELQKYPICPYCGMNRTKFSHSRHLIHYADDLVDGTCSLHCAAISLSLNKDRGPKAIYVGDFGSDAKVKPLVNVENAHYVIDGSKPGTMTKRSKRAYGDKAMAQAAGGEVTDFNGAMRAAYADMAEDTVMVRKKRADKRRKAKSQ
jgi:nitrous oxide reductase accessory protein NosL